MRNTITITSQANANFLKASEQILLFMDELGFTSNTYNDPEMIKHTIAQIIRETIEGNVNISWGNLETDSEPLGVPRNGREDDDETFDPNECDCDCDCEYDDIDTDELLEKIRREVEEEEARKYQYSCGCQNKRQPRD